MQHFSYMETKCGHIIAHEIEDFSDYVSQKCLQRF